MKCRLKLKSRTGEQCMCMAHKAQTWRSCRITWGCPARAAGTSLAAGSSWRSTPGHISASPPRGLFRSCTALPARGTKSSGTALGPLTPHGGGHPAVRRGGPGAGRYLRGGGAGALPGAAGGVIVPPAGAGRQLPVRVVVVEGVAQPAAVPPLPPVILARPRRLRGDRGESAGTGTAPPEPLGALRSPPGPAHPPAAAAGHAAPPDSSPPRPRSGPWPPRPAPRAAGSRLPSARFSHRHPPPSREISTAGTRWVSRNLYSRIQAATEERAEFGGLTRPPAPPGCGGSQVPAGRALCPRADSQGLPLPTPAISFLQQVTVSQLLNGMLLIINIKSNYRGLCQSLGFLRLHRNPTPEAKIKETPCTPKC